MADEPRTIFQVLAAATVLGLLGELLFHDAAWGVNIVFWVAALGLGAIGLSKRLNRPIPRIVKLTAPAILAFAACFAFREAPCLKLANGTVLFLLIGALLVGSRRGSLAQASLTDLTLSAIGAWFKLTSDFASLLVRDITWTKSETQRELLTSVFRGVMIAAPLLALFGTLFYSADEAFQNVLSQVFSFRWLDADWLLQTTVIFCFCVVLATGCYRALLAEMQAEPAPDSAIDVNRPWMLGITELAVVLGSLDALFALFVVVQAQYFFGGAHHLKSVTGLTYAEYARHGFFELTAVAAGALATILGFHRLMKEPVRHRWSFSILSGTLATFVAVVLLSAFQRMNLYIEFAGLTQLRLYTTAFMGWIALALVWLVATVLRGDRKPFAIGALVCGMATVLALNLLNPDATIARFNLGLSGRQVDLAYLESLSLDAAPAVISNASKLPKTQAAQLKTAVRDRWSKEVDTDWRGITYARWRYLRDYRGEL